MLLCVGLIVFSCKSKKAVVAKKPNSEQEQNNAPKGSSNTPKIYTNNTERYIDVHKGTAKQEMKLYGIPASITLAQGILESGAGQGRLAKEANNHFGIKCHEWTGEKIYHDDDKKQECFRKYEHAKYSFRDHSLFLTERDRYAKLFRLHPKDYTGWARGLRNAGYATDRKYPDKLISIIERYRLYKLDEEVLAEKQKISSVNEKKNREGASLENEAKTGVSSTLGTYKVLKGDTQYSISRKFNISVKELQKINGLRNTSLNVGQELNVPLSSPTVDSKVITDVTPKAPKKVATPVKVVEKSNATQVHKVVKGDTQYSISRTYNISVSTLQNMNGLRNTSLNVGQELIVPLSNASESPNKITTNTPNTVKSVAKNTEKPPTTPVKDIQQPVKSTQQIHKVVKGDTQYSISRRYNISVKELQNMNNLKSTSLFIGQALRVPLGNKSSQGKEAKSITPSAKKNTASTIKASQNSDDSKVYKVVKGDTQYSISKKYNITVKELQSMNGLKDTALFIGQELVINPSSKN